MITTRLRFESNTESAFISLINNNESSPLYLVARVCFTEHSHCSDVTRRTGLGFAGTDENPAPGVCGSEGGVKRREEERKKRKKVRNRPRAHADEKQIPPDCGR